LEKIEKAHLGISINPARFRELEIIYNSKKPVLMVDVPFDDMESMKSLEKVNFFWRDAKDAFTQGNFQESLSKFRSHIEALAEFQSKREAKIKENLKNQIQEFLKQNSEYSNKKELKVLIRLGIYHTGVYQDLAKEQPTVSREFSSMPFVYWSVDEAQRRIAFGKELDDLLLARGIIENLFYPYLRKLTDDSGELFRIARKLSSQLSFKDIEQISKNLGRKSIFDIIKELEERIPNQSILTGKSVGQKENK